ncbi:MAG: hypothetical protein JW838_01820 [Spirochaetes bacterium]|nr:hypothetical protein [Spirochaetota bacterium]
MSTVKEALDVVEEARREILFAIKERIRHVTEGSGAPVRLKRVVVKERREGELESLRYYEINNIYLDDDGRLCGDMAGRDDRFNDGILFGREIEDLDAGDLKSVLDALYGGGWSLENGAGREAPSRREGLQAFFMDTRAGISRALRRGA